jgi:hypothetical protein
MAQRVYLESVKAGLTATDRRLFYASTTAPSESDPGVFSGGSPTGEPSTAADGFVTQGIEALHLMFDFVPDTSTGSESVEIQLWWWSSISGVWHAGEAPINVITESTVMTVECLGLERVYIQVKNAVGTFYLSGWAARIIPT